MKNSVPGGMMFWKRRKPEPPTPEVVEVALFPACDLCLQQYNHVLYQAARWFGTIDLEGKEANMCQEHFWAYGIPAKCQKLVLREKSKLGG